MKKAAFRVFASLGANDEDLRKKIIDTEPLMECLVQVRNVVIVTMLL